MLVKPAPVAIEPEDMSAAFDGEGPLVGKVVEYFKSLRLVPRVHNLHLF